MAVSNKAFPHPEGYKPDDFLPLQKDKLEAQDIASIPDYWGEVGTKLLKNPRAVFSICLLTFMLLFSILGPLLWQVDPAQQDLSQVSQAPALYKEALVIEANTHSWKQAAQSLLEQEQEQEQQEENIFYLALFDVAHTQSVKLYWPAHPQAVAYAVYRHEYVPSGIEDLGLPLAELESRSATFFEDKLSLENTDYYYSVVALAKHNRPLDYKSLHIKPVLALPYEQVKKQVEAGNWHWLDEQEAQAYKKVRLSMHPMGTDYLGRDMMARLMSGGQTSLLIALLASGLFVLFGSLYGAISAYLGGRVDNVLMRFADFVIALPFLLFMILLKVSFSVGPGESGISVMIFSLIILSWPGSARLIRGQVLSLREQNFILAARINGASLYYVMLKHLLPNVLSLVLISLSFAIPSVILTEAFLSFIGLGVVPPTASWGSMCQEGIKTFLFHPHELIFPATMIGITVLCFNLLGDSLRDALDVNVE